jgi:hypothetical protein
MPRPHPPTPRIFSGPLINSLTNGCLEELQQTSFLLRLMHDPMLLESSAARRVQARSPQPAPPRGESAARCSTCMPLPEDRARAQPQHEPEAAASLHSDAEAGTGVRDMDVPRPSLVADGPSSGPLETLTGQVQALGLDELPRLQRPDQDIGQQQIEAQHLLSQVFPDAPPAALSAPKASRARPCNRAVSVEPTASSCQDGDSYVSAGN